MKHAKQSTYIESCKVKCTKQSMQNKACTEKHAKRSMQTRKTMWIMQSKEYQVQTKSSDGSTVLDPVDCMSMERLQPIK